MSIEKAKVPITFAEVPAKPGEAAGSIIEFAIARALRDDPETMAAEMLRLMRHNAVLEVENAELRQCLRQEKWR